MAVAATPGLRLLAEHVARFNAGVRAGDFSPMVAAFADDADLIFEGIPVGPFHGRDEIGAAYVSQPPDDEIEILGVHERAGEVTARYRWSRGGLGTMRLVQAENGQIARLVVAFDPADAPADTAARSSTPAAKGAPAAPVTEHPQPRLDPYRLRTDFPILATVNTHGRPLVYLDSAATSQKPLSVIEAVNDFNRSYNSNIHRGIYELAERATAAYEGAREKAARLINAPDPHEVIFVRNATEAINLVAYSWGRKNMRRGDTIVLTEMEHHANLVPWQLLAQECDGDLEFIPITDDGLLRLDVFEVLLRLKPKLVAFTHVSNMLGTINPVREMTAMAHAAGALVLIDGAQAVPHVAVDVQAIGADFYVYSGHKMLGPTGSGALWARRALLEAMPPFMAGGDMIREVHLRRSDWNEIPWKFEAGTPDIAAEIGMGAAADYLMALGMDAVREHELELVRYALEVLPREVPEIELYGPSAEQRGGVISFNLPGIHPHDVAQILDRAGICVRAGHHCTMPLHERFDLAATARASFNVYTIPEEIDALAAGLRDVVRIFNR